MQLTMAKSAFEDGLHSGTHMFPLSLEVLDGSPAQALTWLAWHTHPCDRAALRSCRERLVGRLAIYHTVLQHACLVLLAPRDRLHLRRHPSLFSLRLTRRVGFHRVLGLPELQSTEIDDFCR